MLSSKELREIERGWQALEYYAESIGYKPTYFGNQTCSEKCEYAHEIDGSKYVFCRFYRDFCEPGKYCLQGENQYTYELEDCDMCKNCNAWLQVPDVKNIGICLEDFCEKDCEGWCIE